MWELIRSNQRKSLFLFLGMGICLLLLGFFAGLAIDPLEGGWFGLMMALGVWLVMSSIGYFSSAEVFLSLTQAQPLTPEIHPQLYNVTEEMMIAANLPVMPKLYLMPDKAPNAFATGIGPQKSAVVVTSGLLARLNRDELQGVIAHEMSHVLNRDILFMSMAGILLGSITLIAEVFIRGTWYSSRSYPRFSSKREFKGAGQAQAILILVGIVIAILAPIFAQLLYFAISRKREYLADATAARLTRYPEGLASALEKIALSPERLHLANSVTAPMFIVNPLSSVEERLSHWTSTHPPVKDRIRILRSMMGQANYQDYQAAYEKVSGRKETLIPASGLKDNAMISIREASPAELLKERNHKTQMRDIGDLLRAANGFVFVTCVCGLKIKVPPDFKHPEIHCPRCNSRIDVPLEDMMTVNTLVGEKDITTERQQAFQRRATLEPQVYQRKSESWESVRCLCGKVMQISPLFAGTHIKCSHCGRTTQVDSQ